MTLIANFFESLQRTLQSTSNVMEVLITVFFGSCLFLAIGIMIHKLNN